GQILYEVEQVLTCDDRDHYDNIRSWLETEQYPKVYDYLEGAFVEDLKAKAYQAAADKSHELVRDKDYPALDRLFHTCFADPNTDTRTLDFKKELDTVLGPENIQSIPIGYDRLDRHMHDKGPARGEVMVWLANTGVGKTTLLLNCARNIEQTGYRVLYVTLE